MRTVLRPCAFFCCRRFLFLLTSWEYRHIIHAIEVGITCQPLQSLSNLCILCSRAARRGLPLGTEDAYMNSNLLEVSGLHVSAGEKEILHGVDLTVGKDETHVLMGPNGTGKSRSATRSPAIRSIRSQPERSSLTARTSRSCRSMSAQKRAFSCPSRIRSRCPA